MKWRIRVILSTLSMLYTCHHQGVYTNVYYLGLVSFIDVVIGLHPRSSCLQGSTSRYYGLPRYSVSYHIACFTNKRNVISK